jgi:hypothetical protein
MNLRWMRVASAAIFLAAGLFTAPLGMPLLSPGRSMQYQKGIGLRPSSAEKGVEGELPSFFASMFGWKITASTVDSVYRSLSPEDRAQRGIFSENYAVVGAIEFYGRQYGLPHVISAPNSYWLWGTRGYTGELMIIVGGNVDILCEFFDEVSVPAHVRSRYVQPQYAGLPVVVVRKPKQPVALIWPRIKNYI